MGRIGKIWPKPWEKNNKNAIPKMTQMLKLSGKDLKQFNIMIHELKFINLNMYRKTDIFSRERETILWNHVINENVITDKYNI